MKRNILITGGAGFIGSCGCSSGNTPTIGS